MPLMQTCLKCGYTRTAMDDATPEGVCPKCSVAYVKLRAGVSRTFATKGVDRSEERDFRARMFVVTWIVSFVLIVLGGVSLISGLLGMFFGQGFAIALTAAGSGASLCATGLGLLYLAGIYENTLQR